MEQTGKDTMIPYIVYESTLAKEDAQQRRLVTIIVFLIVLLVVTNIIWLVAWNQYDYVDDYSVDVDANDGGNANYIGNDGDIYNGTNHSQENQGEDSSQ